MNRDRLVRPFLLVLLLSNLTLAEEMIVQEVDLTIALDEHAAKIAQSGTGKTVVNTHPQLLDRLNDL